MERADFVWFNFWLAESGVLLEGIGRFPASKVGDGNLWGPLTVLCLLITSVIFYSSRRIISIDIWHTYLSLLHSSRDGKLLILLCLVLSWMVSVCGLFWRLERWRSVRFICGSLFVGG